MAEPYYPTGAQKNKSSAIWVTALPLTTQQITVDRSNVANMRAVTGANINKGTAGG